MASKLRFHKKTDNLRIGWTSGSNTCGDKPIINSNHPIMMMGTGSISYTTTNYLTTLSITQALRLADALLGMVAEYRDAAKDK